MPLDPQAEHSPRNRVNSKGQEEGSADV